MISFDSERQGQGRVVAVTGACSFLGSHLIAAMEEDRSFYKILAMDVRKPSFPLAKTQFHRIDLTLPTAGAMVASALGRENVDTVAHLAFLSDFTPRSEWAHELESVGTMHVLNACAECQVDRYIHWSLTSLYGASPENPNFIGEDRRLPEFGELNFLADKVEAEKQVASFRRENTETAVSVLRTAPIVGPTIGNFLTRFLKRRVVPILMGYDPLIQLLHEEDAVDAFWYALNHRVEGIHNIVGRGVLPLTTTLALMGRVPIALPRALVTQVAKMFWMFQVSNVPPGFWDFLTYLSVADGSKAETEWGWRSKKHILDILGDFSGVKPPLDVSPSEENVVSR